jgi:hypothetical protein
VNKLTLQLGASGLVTVDTILKYPKDYQVQMPPDDAVVYDISEFDSYTDTFDLEKYFSGLSDKFGINLNSILSLYMDASDE